MNPELDASFVEKVSLERQQFALPRLAIEHTELFTNQILGILYPHFSKHVSDRDWDLVADCHLANDLLRKILSPLYDGDISPIVDRFWKGLPGLREALDADANAINQSDPASSGVDEVILCYPGFLGIAIHRIAHFFHDERVPLLPRLLGEYAHRQTSIDIHAGARIGRGFAIDHGTGIVIGGSAIIGNGVSIYQGVTLGALAVKKSLAGAKRHPTLEDDVTVYANATILGGSTVVGAGSIVGGNVWLTESVPPNSRITRSTIVRSTEDPLEFYI